ncbi:MAG: hypothetical protein Alpg2KO_10120 [Alphaproteobacteria bacterium]
MTRTLSLLAALLMAVLLVTIPQAEAQSAGRPLSLVEALQLAEKTVGRKADGIEWIAEDQVPVYAVVFSHKGGTEHVLIHAITGEVVERHRETLAQMRQEPGLATAPTAQKVDLAGAIQLVQKRKQGWVFEAYRDITFKDQPVYVVIQRFRSGEVISTVDGWAGRIVLTEQEEEDEDHDEFE